MGGIRGEKVKQAYEDKFGSCPPDDFIGKALLFFQDQDGKDKDREKIVPWLIRFAEKMNQDGREQGSNSSGEYHVEAKASVPQGKNPEENIKLDALHQKLKPWVLHWRETIFEQEQPPFETVKAAFEWIEDVAGKDEYLDDKKAEQCRERGLSWTAIMQDDDLPDVFPAVVAGHDLQVDNSELKREPTEAERKLLNDLREREDKAEQAEIERLKKASETNGPAQIEAEIIMASAYFSRLQSDAESLSRSTEFTEVGLLMFVLTGFKPSGTRYRIKKHHESITPGQDGTLNKFGWYERDRVTVELLSQTITGDDLQEIVSEAKGHFGTSGEKYLTEDQLELWNITKDLGGLRIEGDEWEPPERFDTKKEFCNTVAKERWDEPQEESNDPTQKVYRAIDRLIERLNRRYPGLLHGLDCTT